MPINGRIAPVCPISRSQPVSGQPGQLSLASIPYAVDLPSLIRAVNAIGQLLQQLAGPGLAVNNVYPPPSRPFGQPQLAREQEKGAVFIGYPEWDEDNRVTDDVRVYHKEVEAGGVIKADKTQWVDVTRINKIDFLDRNSEDLLTWEYGHAAPGVVGPGMPNGALEEDFFQRVVDVSWGGLAVEFYPEGAIR